MSFFHKKSDVNKQHVERLLAIFKRIHTDSVWTKVTEDDFTTERFEAGYVNDVCACILTEDAQKRFEGNCHPVGIVVKIFPDEPLIRMNAVHRGIVCSMVSTHRIGPKLIYMDEECSINEYIIGSRHYGPQDDEDEQFVGKVMRLLARYHTMEVPISDTFQEGWIKRLIKFLDEFPGSGDVWNGKYLQYMDENPVLKPLRHEFETMDFKYLYYLIEAQHEIKCPLVFSHMDFHRLNRLVLEKANSKELYLVDLDWSLYSYRGYDLAAFFDSLYQSEPHFCRESFASDDTILKFLEQYRQECATILGGQYLLDPKNDLQRMLREVKFFVINYSAVMSFFATSRFAQNPSEPENVEMIVGTQKRLALFKELKKRFTDEGIMPDIKFDCASSNAH